MPKSFKVTDLPSQLQQHSGCVYCHTEIVLNDHIILCDICNSPHHVDCWQSHNEECAIFGCSTAGASTADTSTPNAGASGRRSLLRSLFRRRSLTFPTPSSSFSPPRATQPTPATYNPLGPRYVRTPEHDSRFEHGETYRDTQTGRICWFSEGFDPNR